jgi:dTDP-4-amino-4,6-dideoxygalactose transaminase
MSPTVSDVATRIPITAPWLDDQEFAAVARPLRSGWLTQGPEVAAFEREFAALRSRSGTQAFSGVRENRRTART